MKPTIPEFYLPDLAFVHDQGHGQLARHAAQAISRLLEGRPERSLVVDLGCGSGILAQELADKPLDIVGVDYSPFMIELARKNAPGATFITSSMYDYDIPVCDLVCSVGECFNYMFDPACTSNALRELFARVHHALRPGGHFVFDILTPKVLDSSFAQSRILENDLWTIFLEIETNREANRLTRHITLFLKKEGGYEKSKEIHRQRLYHQRDMENMLTDLGFGFTLLADYHGMLFRDGQIGFVCTKV